MVIRQTNALPVKTIHVRRIQNWISVYRHFAVSLIVRHHEYNVGSGPNRNLDQNEGNYRID